MPKKETQFGTNSSPLQSSNLMHQYFHSKASWSSDAINVGVRGKSSRFECGSIFMIGKWFCVVESILLDTWLSKNTAQKFYEIIC